MSDQSREPAGAADGVPGRGDAADLLLRFQVLPASHLFRAGHFARRQEIDTEWMRPEQCWLLIFVSHRWETLRHPDPAGRQWRTLAKLVSDLCDLWDALGTDDAHQRIRLVPRLDQHGIAQAAVLFSRLNPPEGASAPGPDTPARAFLPDRIGIWYDYACMPQRPWTPGEEEEFRAGLLALPRLFGSEHVILLALREAGDDYGSRGWCLAESLSAAAGGQRGVAVRMDLLGTPLTLGADGQDRNQDLSRRLRAALRGWADTTVDAAVAAECLMMLAVTAGYSQSEWFSPSDGIAPVYLGDVVNTAGAWLGKMLARLALRRGRSVDLAVLLRELAHESGVRCAVDDDLVYVALLMLHTESADGSPIRKFYADCIERFVSGRPIVTWIAENPGPDVGYEDVRLEPG
jgi:hypothetical protein